MRIGVIREAPVGFTSLDKLSNEYKAAPACMITGIAMLCTVIADTAYTGKPIIAKRLPKSQEHRSVEGHGAHWNHENGSTCRNVGTL